MPLAGRPKPDGNGVCKAEEYASVKECKAWLAEALEGPAMPAFERRMLSGWLWRDVSLKGDGALLFKG